MSDTLGLAIISMVGILGDGECGRSEWRREVRKEKGEGAG